MPFALFHDFFPGLAARETRSITLTQDSDSGLPAGDYGLLESFCDEPGCDCRRAMLTVVSAASQSAEAVIAFGWEDPEFYARWMKDDDPEVVAELKGPVLNLGSRQGDHAPTILELTEQLLISDEAYVNRVRQHYEMVRANVDAAASPATRHPRIGRNAPCPCGSGEKHKKCCLRATGLAPVGAETPSRPAYGAPSVSSDCGLDVRELDAADFSIREEVNYIVRRAAEHETRIVRTGALLMFSTHSGDAWLLDTEDYAALPLASGGDSLPVRILETERSFSIEWTHDFRIEGDTFAAIERATGREQIITGYPTRELRSC